MRVVIVGSRDRSSVRIASKAAQRALSEEAVKGIMRRDRELIGEIVTSEYASFGVALTIVSMGANDGVGLIAKEKVDQYRRLGCPVEFVECAVHLTELRARAAHSTNSTR